MSAVSSDTKSEMSCVQVQNTVTAVQCSASNNDTKALEVDSCNVSKDVVIKW